MKQNYNPYTVPEGFFEETVHKASCSYTKRVRTLKYVFLSAAAAAVLIVIPVFVRQQDRVTEPVLNEYSSNSLAVMYDYDIFLQVNF